MKKRIVSMVLVLMLLLSFTVYAASDYKGFTIVNVKVDGKPLTLEIPAINFYGSTMLPLRKVAESLDAIVTWDSATSTAMLKKPEVEMLFCDDYAFGDSAKGVKNTVNPDLPVDNAIFQIYGTKWDAGPQSFTAYCDVSELGVVGLVEYRILVEGPDGTVVQSSSDSIELTAEDRGAFIAFPTFLDVDMKTPGSYKVKFQLKDQGEYKTIKQRLISVS